MPTHVLPSFVLVVALPLPDLAGFTLRVPHGRFSPFGEQFGSVLLESMLGSVLLESSLCVVGGTLASL